MPSPPPPPRPPFPPAFPSPRAGGRTRLSHPGPGRAEPFDVSVDPIWVEQVVAAAHRRVPALGTVPLASSYAGLYEMSPDEHALLGPAEDVANLFLVNGSSGHGVMHAPALGQLAAEMLAGARPALDVRALRPSRFREGHPNPHRPL